MPETIRVTVARVHEWRPFPESKIVQLDMEEVFRELLFEHESEAVRRRAIADTAEQLAKKLVGTS